MANIEIVHVLYSFGTGGLEKGIATVARHGSGRFRHTIVCLTISGASERLLPAGTRVIELRKPPGNSIRSILKLRRILRELRPDVVHTRNWSGLDGVIAARLAGIGAVVHGEHGWGMEDPDGLDPKRIRIRRLLRRWAREYTCVSKQMEHWLTDQVRVGRPVTQIYNGVDTERFAPGDGSAVRKELGVAEDAFVVGTVGRLDPIKDHGTLIEAFRELRRRRPGAVLLLVGDGPERARLEPLAGDGVRLLRARSDVPELMRGFNVFALSSRNEGISNTILEAMAVGLPVVATRVGGNPELVEDGRTGCLVPPGRADALTAAFLQYAEDPGRALRHGEAGRRAATERFSIPRMVAGYEGVYRRFGPRGHQGGAGRAAVRPGNDRLA